MMAASGQGASPTSYSNASIIDVLLAYGSRGGALYAAYRHPDNPLLLTHIRWQGQGGEALEAHRGPDDMSMVREEREAWARVALLSTTLRPESVGPNAPWLQAPLDPREAHELATRALRAREASAPPGGAGVSSYGFNSSGPVRPSGYAGQASPPVVPGFASSSAPGYPPPAHGDLNEMISVSDPNGAIGGPYSALSEPTQVTGGWRREALGPQYQPSAPQYTPQPGYPATHQAPPSQPGEIIVVVCIEVEMPNLAPSMDSDITRDFAKDVALTFNRAAHTIPQTRATRGWMRGSHMTLGALMALGTGARPATRAEMEHAAETLASALAYRTLPYVRLRFADAAEWAQGVALPE